MYLRNCEHCGSTFWGTAEARFCPLCAVIEKTEEKFLDRPAETPVPQMASAVA
jgi:hypothetical protein